MNKKITAFLGVFEGKADKLRKRIKQELEKPKEQRDKSFLKKSLEEAKQLRNLVRELKDDEKVKIKCPHCHEHFEI